MANLEKKTDKTNTYVCVFCAPTHFSKMLTPDVNGFLWLQYVIM